MNGQSEVNKKKNIALPISLLIICCVGLLIRIYNLSGYQIGIHADEASIGYDAYCIANYGVDRHLLSYPLLFPGFGGGGHSALYTYCCALLVKIAGSNIYTLRLPAVLFSMVTVITGTLIVRELFHNVWMELGFAALTSFLPYFFLASRFGLDCNLMLGTSTLFLLFFIKAANSQKNIFFFLAGISGGLVLYTYSLAYLVVPFFLVVALWYVIRMHKVSWEKAIVFIFPLIFLALPLVLIQYINISGHENVVFGPFTLPRLRGYRGSELSYPQLASFVQTLFVTFLFDEIPYNSSPKWLNLFIISIPFLCVGIGCTWSEFKSRAREKCYNPMDFILFWTIAEWLVGSMIQSGAGTNVNRMNGIFAAYVIMILYGVQRCLVHISKKGKKAGIILLTSLYGVLSILFYKDVLKDQEMKIYFECNYEEGLSDLQKKMPPDNMEKIMIVRDVNPIFYRYAAKLDPYEYPEEDNIEHVHYAAEDIMQDAPHVCIVDHEQQNMLENLRNSGDYTENEYKRYSVFYYDK